MAHPTDSFYQAAWHKLKKNKTAIAGLVIICFSVLVALFGYFLAPDPTPYANRIILEDGGRKPGYTQEFLLFKKEQQAPPTNFFNHLLFGVRDTVDYIPIVSASFIKNSVHANRYID